MNDKMVGFETIGKGSLVVFDVNEIEPMDDQLLVMVPELPDKKNMIHLSPDAATTMYGAALKCTILAIGKQTQTANETSEHFTTLKVGDKIALQGQVITLRAAGLPAGNNISFIYRTDIRFKYKEKVISKIKTNLVTP